VRAWAPNFPAITAGETRTVHYKSLGTRTILDRVARIALKPTLPERADEMLDS